MERRFARQELFAPIGVEGQRAIGATHVVLVGLGAVGAACAEQLVRAGIGALDLADRDCVEESNLPRQTLYTAEDAERLAPKAVAARDRLAKLGGGTRLSCLVRDIAAGSAGALLPSPRAERLMIADATDNFETRYLLSDLAVREGVAHAYGGAIGATAAAGLFLPGGAPCLRCLFPEAPPPGSYGTCDTDGVIGPAAHAAASLLTAMVMRYAARGAEHPFPFVNVDVWRGTSSAVDLVPARRDPDCAACARRAYPALAPRGDEVVALCGRDTYQVTPPSPAPELDLAGLALRLGRVGEVSVAGPHLLRAVLPAARLTVFPDGRALVQGVDGPEKARRVYAEALGG